MENQQYFTLNQRSNVTIVSDAPLQFKFTSRAFDYSN